MNIIKTETPFLVEATSTGCNDRKDRNITYIIIESIHTLCLDKEELVQAQIKPCQRLLKLPYEEEGEIDLIENERIKLGQVLNTVRNDS